MPDIQAPPEIEVELDCPNCNYILIPQDRAAWNGYVPTLALLDDGDMTVVHTHCSFRCTACDERYINGSMGSYANSVNGRDVCNKCWELIKANDESIDWTTCDDCGTYVRDDRRFSDALWSAHRDMYLCNSCYECDIECSDCGMDYLESDGHNCDDPHEEDNGSRYIHSYGYKPSPRFFGDTLYHLGLELEVEAKDGDYNWGAEYVYNQVHDRAYLKYDGSLRNGFEIVSHPHSLEEFQKEFPWHILDELKTNGFRSWNTRTCGIHVHVSRRAFKRGSWIQEEAHQIKFMKLIYDNQRQVQRLAGRESSYAKFDDKGKIVQKVKAGYQTSGRYSAINTENDSTIEVRVFRGTLRKERVLSALEFVHAAVEYTRNLKMVASEKPLSWIKFIGYVSDNSKQYPNLFLVINELFDKESTDYNQPEEDN